MKILFLTQTCVLGPSSRYRVYQLLPFLKEMGMQCEVSPGIDEDLYRSIYIQGHIGGKIKALRAIWNKRSEDLKRIDDFDVIVVQKGIFPDLYSGFESKISKKKPLIFDFDDAIWLPRLGGSKLVRFLHRSSVFGDIASCCTAVIAGNEYLAEYVRRFNKNVCVVPSTVDMAKYSAGGDCSVVGWIGSRTTLAYLNLLKNVFVKLRIKPCVIASGDSAGLEFEADFVPWRLEDESEHMKKIGIGVAPLPDTAWERGKCGVKILQFMASSIPVIASPVGVANEMIRHGVNGFLANIESEWMKFLAMLISDRDLRVRMGREGRKMVEASYSLRQSAQKVAKIIQSVVID